MDSFGGYSQIKRGSRHPKGPGAYFAAYSSLAWLVRALRRTAVGSYVWPRPSGQPHPYTTYRTARRVVLAEAMCPGPFTPLGLGVATGKEDRKESEEGMEEERVTLVGLPEHKDVFDLAAGLRFVEGRATGVPLSLAEKVVSERRGYYIEYPTRYEPTKAKAKGASRD